jgi:hypothetical protein
MLNKLNAVFKAAKFGETTADPASSSQHEVPEFISRVLLLKRRANGGNGASYSNNFSGATVSR